MADSSTPQPVEAPEAPNPFAVKATVEPEPDQPLAAPPPTKTNAPVVVAGVVLLLGLGLFVGRQTAQAPGPNGPAADRSKPKVQPDAPSRPQAPPTPPQLSPREKARQLADQAWRDLRQAGRVAALHSELFWKSASDDDRLLVACRHGETALAKALLAAGGSVNAVDFAADQHPPVYRVGATPLMLAIESGKMDLVRLLLDKGADVEQRDASHDTILLRAIRGGNEELARLMLDSGANALARNDRSNESAYGLAFAKKMPRLCRELERRGGHF